MGKITRLLIVILGLALAFGQPASAAVVYSNENDFKAQLASGYYLEDFSDYIYGWPLHGEATENYAGGSGFAYQASAPKGLYSGYWALSTADAYDALTITFTGASVRAVGGIFTPTGMDGLIDPGYVVVTLSDGTSQQLLNPTANTFLAFTTNLPISSLTVDAPEMGGPMIWPQLDHFYVGNTGVGTVIPVPSAAWAGLALLSAMVVHRTLRRRKQASFLAMNAAAASEPKANEKTAADMLLDER